MEIRDFFDAKARISGILHKQPLEFTKYFSDMSGASVYLKCENTQKTGSFKVRGAYNKISKMVETEAFLKEVVACSMGNHAQAVAFAATEAGVKSTIVMPKSATLVKIEATRGYGAEVVLHGNTYSDAFDYAKELEKKTGAVYIPGFDNDEIIAGAGTVGLEILEELINVDTIVIPAGGGGLLAGVAYIVKQVNPKVRIVGVQSAGATALYTSFKTGKIVTSATSTFADGISVQKPGLKPYELIRDYVDEIVLVTDEEISDTLIGLLERCKQVVEPSGAASLAAVASGKVNVKGQNVVCIISGGNLDLELVYKLIERHLKKPKER